MSRAGVRPARFRSAGPTGEVSDAQRRAGISNDDRWKTFFFRIYGYEVEANSRRCPRTRELLRCIPGMTTAMFSILAPSKQVPAHVGPFKGVLRYHLGLQVPATDDRCGIRVGDTVRHWEEGKSLVFDDTFVHEAWNHTDQDRVILFVDFLRPLRGFVGAYTRMLLTLTQRLHVEVTYARDNALRLSRAFQ